MILPPPAGGWRLPVRDGPPLVMGVLNATPDSFSGDGLGGDADALVARGLAQADAGAGIVDVGGESTRLGAVPVPAEEELRRVLPVVERLARHGRVPVSVDTTKPRVADAALGAGAVMVNDVSGLREPELAAVVARHGAWLVVMHNGWETPLSGPPREAVDEVAEALRRLADRALAAGVREDRLAVDPGLGFGKAPQASLELLRRAADLRERLMPFPMLVGPSRKGFVGRALGRPVDERLEGTLACVAIAVFAGVEVVRVHDVGPAAPVARMAWAVRRGWSAEMVPLAAEAPGRPDPTGRPP